MLKNYFKTAFRNLGRNKAYAIINITGIAVGIAACLLIFLVIQFETSFDNFHKNKERIYRVSEQINNPDGVSYTRGTCFPAGKQLLLDYPQLENVAAISSSAGEQITVMDEQNHPTQKKFDEDGLFFIQPHSSENSN